MDSDKQTEAVRFDDFIEHAPALFDEAEAGKDITVERNGSLFRLSPLRARKPRRRRKLSADDPLWGIVGIGHSEGPADISTNKHKYLAEAAADQHNPTEP